MSNSAGPDTNPLWHRVVRRAPDGRVLDWVEVGQCAACGRGVDREFSFEYRTVAGTLLCCECAAPTDDLVNRRNESENRNVVSRA